MKMYKDENLKEKLLNKNHNLNINLSNEIEIN